MAACSSNGKQFICFFLFYYYYFIIKDEFEFNDLEYLYVDFRIKSQQFRDGKKQRKAQR